MTSIGAGAGAGPSHPPIPYLAAAADTRSLPLGQAQEVSLAGAEQFSELSQLRFARWVP
jgi:hypothetical protein